MTPASTSSSRAIAAAVMSQIHASRGERRPARLRALEAVPVVRQLRVLGAEMECSWTLARLELLEGSGEAALEHCREMLRRWEETEDRHYSLNALAWSAGIFAEQGQEEDLNRVVRALAVIAAENGNSEALAMLARALGALALGAGRCGRRRRAFPARHRPAPRDRAPARPRRAPRERSRGRARASVSTIRRASGWATRASTRAASAPGRCRRRPSARSPSSAPPAPTPSRGRRPDPPPAAGHPARRRGSHEPRDRDRAVPLGAHGRHARAAFADRARLPVAPRRRAQGRRARPARAGLEGEDVRAGRNSYSPAVSLFDDAAEERRAAHAPLADRLRPHALDEFAGPAAARRRGRCPAPRDRGGPRLLVDLLRAAGHRQDDARAHHRGEHAVGLRGAVRGLVGQGRRAGRDRPRARAPRRAGPAHGALHRRDPPLQQGAAGRAPAGRRVRARDADRRDDREPVPLGHRRARLALPPVRVQSHSEDALLARARARRGRARRPAGERDVLAAIAATAAGDARHALSTLELAHEHAASRGSASRRGRGRRRSRACAVPCATTATATTTTTRSRRSSRACAASDPDAALFYLAVMLEGGEDPRLHRAPDRDPRQRGHRQRRPARARAGRRPARASSSWSACPSAATRSRRRPPTSRWRRSRTPRATSLGARAREAARAHATARPPSALRDCQLPRRPASSAAASATATRTTRRGRSWPTTTCRPSSPARASTSRPSTASRRSSPSALRELRRLRAGAARSRA